MAKQYLLVENICKRMLPFCLMYGAYVIVHGHITPGGGFQGGVVIGAGYIFYVLAFGLKEGRKAAPKSILGFTDSLGGLIYALVGLIGIIMGYNFLANKVLSFPPVGSPGMLFSGGTLFFINIGVGVHVLSTVITVFYTFLEESPEKEVEAELQAKRINERRRWSDARNC